MTTSLLRAIDRFGSKRVLVLGDAMLDSYVVGSSTRLCQEEGTRPRLANNSSTLDITPGSALAWMEKQAV